METKPRTILHVEDDPDDRILTKDAFRFVDKEVVFHSVNDGEAALLYLLHLSREEYPFLILLDYNVPKLNGLETLKLLQRSPLYKNIPAVMLTTSRDPLYRQKCLEAGASKFYVKPVIYKELVAIARELLG